MNRDVYFHKTVTLRAGNQQLEFRTSQELFSSHDIDTGTRSLLRSVIEAGYRTERVLDMGCGYGPLGLTLKKLRSESSIHMVDRDALAIAYSRQNAALNGLEGVEIYGSLGYDDVKRAGFDLIVANIPGKAGEAVIAYLLRETRHYLAPGGAVAIVVVAALESNIKKILEDTPGAEIKLKSQRSGHTIFHYEFTEKTERIPRPGRSALERGVYHRNDIDIRLDNLSYSVQTAYGLPDFDSLGYGSRMLIRALCDLKVREIQRVAVFKPGQGHVAVATWKILRPAFIELIDRDLLALRYSRLNLIKNGCPPEKINLSHQVGVEPTGQEKYDLIAGFPGEEGRQAMFLSTRQAVERLSPGGSLIVAGGSTAMARLADRVKSEGELRIKARERRRGYSLLALEKVL